MKPTEGIQDGFVSGFWDEIIYHKSQVEHKVHVKQTIKLDITLSGILLCPLQHTFLRLQH